MRKKFGKKWKMQTKCLKRAKKKKKESKQDNWYLRQLHIKNHRSSIAGITTSSKGLLWETFVKYRKTELHSQMLLKTLLCNKESSCSPSPELMSLGLGWSLGWTIILSALEKRWKGPSRLLPSRSPKGPWWYEVVSHFFDGSIASCREVHRHFKTTYAALSTHFWTRWSKITPNTSAWLGKHRVQDWPVSDCRYVENFELKNATRAPYKSTT